MIVWYKHNKINLKEMFVLKYKNKNLSKKSYSFPFGIWSTYSFFKSVIKIWVLIETKTEKFHRILFSIFLFHIQITLNK